MNQREIKFRAWNKHHTRMYDVLSIDFKYGLINALSKDGTTHTFGFIDVDLLQYAEEADNNNTPIYQGDILSYKWDECLEGHIIAEGTEIFEVVFEEFQWTLKDGEGNTFPMNDTGFDYVIGNIYENPGLLTPNHPQP